MKKIILLATVLAFFVGAESLVPKKSEAGVTCKYDWLGNYVCNETNSYGGLTGNSSSTRTDWLQNDVTTFSTNGMTTGTMSCKTDWLGNYVCN